jgi:NitT/TauT family transport system ATP-binding protein
MDRPPLPSPSPAPKIAISGVSKTFDSASGAVHAVAGIDLSITEGEFVSIAGPSGCGKSTLLYMLGGFVPPSSGEMRVGGRAVVGPGIDRGIVFQEYALFPWLTVYDNIAYGLRRQGLPSTQIKATVERYVSLIGLEGFQDRYPRELSGGMKQRVALARTFAYEPDILLLDEPFGALDSQTREQMQDELLRLWRSTGKTILMVTHDVAEAVYLSNRVCVMSSRPGRIVRIFPIELDRGMAREDLILTESYRVTHNNVWLAVRRQAGARVAP